MLEFERSYQSIRGRTIAVTSWLSEDTHTWQASAPGFSINSMGNNTFSSRHAAVNSVMTKVEQLINKPEEHRHRRTW